MNRALYGKGPHAKLKGSVGKGPNQTNYYISIQIGVWSEFLESKENHEKHRREKNHFDEAAFDPKYKKGPEFLQISGIFARKSK